MERTICDTLNSVYDIFMHYIKFEMIVNLIEDIIQKIE